MSAPDLTPTQSAEVERLMELVIDCESAAKEWLVAAPGFSAMKAADHKEARESLRTALSALVVRADREPLTQARIIELRGESSRAAYDDFRPWSSSIHFARAIERAHGIGITKEQGS